MNYLLLTVCISYDETTEVIKSSKSKTGIQDNFPRNTVISNKRKTAGSLLFFLAKLVTQITHAKHAGGRDINASANFSCAHPPPGLMRAFARLVSSGGGASANFALPRGRAFASPGPTPNF